MLDFLIFAWFIDHCPWIIGAVALAIMFDDTNPRNDDGQL